MKKAIICFPAIKSGANQYPTGLYKIATWCKDEYDIIVLDQRLEHNVYNTINDIIDENVLCLGLSVMTGEQIKYALDISKVFHDKIKIVWGGIHPTNLPKQTIENAYIDYIIIGDGEDAFLNLLRYLDSMEIDEELFFSKNNNNCKHNRLDRSGLNKKYVDFDKYPIRDEYFIKRDGFKKAFTLETSRGCPFQCFFCHNSIYRKTYRSIEDANVIKIIEELERRYNVDGIIFQEDNFFANHVRIDNVINYLKSKPNIGWKASGRISDFSKLLEDKTFAENLSQSGCKILQFGIESGSQKILDMINKKMKLEDVISVNQELARFPIKLRYNFIVGFPGEEMEDINQTFEFIKFLRNENENVEYPFVNIYNPYPGTVLYNKALKYGFKEPCNVEEWAHFNWNKASFGWFSTKERSCLEDISREYYEKTSYLK